jgi:hypothetical protein
MEEIAAMKHKTPTRRPRNPYATAVRKLKMRVKTSARAYSRKAKHPNPRPQDGGSSFVAIGSLAASAIAAPLSRWAEERVDPRRTTRTVLATMQ